MGAVRTSSTSYRAIWSLLRRTRQRFQVVAREQPVVAARLGRIIESLAVEEAGLIAEDPELPFRRGRGPRTPSTDGDAAVASLMARIEELEHAVQVREEYLAIVAHDLRSPLSPVMLLVGNLLDDVLAAGPAPLPGTMLKPRLEAIARRLEQFVGKLNELLDSTRLQVDNAALQPERLDLVAIARSVVAELTSVVQQHVQVDVVGDDELLGEWDRVRVEQIIRNLVANAVRFGGFQPIEVRVEHAIDHRAGRVTVIDRGMGILLTDQERIFDRHVRLRGGSGFGLGLWIVRQLVTAMGGTVSVTSSPGRGATFEVLLPLELEARPPGYR